MSWAPNEQGVVELLSVLRDSTSGDTETQREVERRLQSFNTIPDYPAYLAHIMSAASGVTTDERYRSIAGLLLKNNTKMLPECPPPAVDYVKVNVLLSVKDTSHMVRQTAGSIVVAVMAAQGVESWPEALGALMSGMDSQNEDEIDGSISTMQKICEDLPKRLDIEISGQRPLDFMIPKFISFVDHPSARFRISAITCINSFIPVNPPSLAANLDSFIVSLFRRASDETPDVRRVVCQALTLLLASRPDKLLSELPNVAEFMIYSMQDRDESVSLEACEFWLGFAESDELKDHLKVFLPKVAPVLLNGMVYTDTDLMWLDGGEEDDAAVPDRAEDIKPKFYGGKSHGFESGQQYNEDGTPKPSTSGAGKSRNLGEEEEEEEEEYSDDEADSDDGFSSEWNLRKCSAAALDVMSVQFEGDLLEILLPYLKEKLFSEDWLQRECGILALGAMAEGCIEGIEPHLPTLIPYLINMLNDLKPLVRAITCWTIGRYSSWCVIPGPNGALGQFFLPAMEGLLKMVLDNNKRVQEAGCSAFATLEEEAGSQLAPLLEPIIRNLVFAFQKYQQKNLLILYDAIGTLADSVGDALNNEACVDILMPPLIEKWNKLQDTDEDIIPLLECFSSVTIASGMAFAKYAVPVYERCLKIIASNLQAVWEVAQGARQDYDEPDKTFLIVALDLLSGLTQGLKAGMAELVAPPGTQGVPPLVAMLQSCLNHHEASVRQSAYALLGDIAISCPLLNGYLHLFLARVLQEIQDQVAQPQFHEVSVCNNAAWAVGEIAIQCKPTAVNPSPELRNQLQPYVPGLNQCLIAILLAPGTPKSLLENAAVTIGRLGLIFPEVAASHLDKFAKNWCTALWEIKDNEEKASAFMGFCNIITVNPTGLLPHFIYFCNAVCKWTTPSEELNNMFAKVLGQYKSMMGEAWASQVGAFPPALQERLRVRYGL